MHHRPPRHRPTLYSGVAAALLLAGAQGCDRGADTGALSPSRPEEEGLPTGPARGSKNRTTDSSVGNR